MRILDKNNIELENPDLDKGYLIEDTQLIHHDAVEAVEEVGHWVTLREYPNGGKDVDWVIEIPGIEASAAWDENESIYRYIEYTAEELKIIEEERNQPSTTELLNILMGVTE